jgi:hypothetical protein
VTPFTYSISSETSKKVTTETTSYRLHLKAETLAVDVDPRDTLAAYLISWSFAHSLFVFMKHPARKALVLIGFIIGSTCQGLSLLFNPVFGYGSVVQIPIILAMGLLFNRAILSVLIRTFEWWAMLSLLLICAGSTLDAVKFDPPRIVTICMFAINGLFIISFDARPFVKQRKSSDTLFWLYTTVLVWIVLILWWCGKWIDVRETVIPIDSIISINVQSIGFSAYCTLAVLTTK